MTQLGSAVAYVGLPIASGGAHGLGRISAKGALDAWQQFLDTRAVATATRCHFLLSEPPQLKVQASVVAVLNRHFPGSGRLYPVSVDLLDEAIELLESIEPQPTNPYGMAPVWLRATTEFQLRSPHGSGLWPGQDRSLFRDFETPAGVKLGTSVTYLNLEARRSMGLMMSIPEASDQDLADVIPWLHASLPFRLSGKRWTRWTLTKNGDSYRERRITPITPTGART